MKTLNPQTRIALLSVVFVAFITGCAIYGDSPATPPRSPLAATFEAHGGLDRWQQQGTMSYRLDGFPLSPQVTKPNTSTVDLRSRRNRIEGEEFTVGFDGDRAWSLPKADAAGLPTRFFNLGSFYFIGMPFVFADPGVNVESTGLKEFRGTDYLTFRVNFAASVGHSADDNYVLYVDPQNHRLRLIHHSVTELSPDLRVVWLFDEWQEVDGLLMAQQITYHPDWNGGELSGGAVTVISQMEFSTETPDPQIYAPPRGAVVDAS